LTTESVVSVSPHFFEWASLARPAIGSLFGKSLHMWQNATRELIGLPKDQPIVMVGHQPTLFHPGILSKFIAARRVADEIGGIVVFLVVDHHIGPADELQRPIEGEHLSIDTIKLTNLDSTIAMKDQEPVVVHADIEPFSTALHQPKSENAAMQFAFALQEMMLPYVSLDQVLPASSLMQTEFVNSVVDEMMINTTPCLDAYNASAEMFPSVGIQTLKSSELPVWQGPRNDRTIQGNADLRPRAILLTLIARLVACDLFVHGTGGMHYDQCMESWCKQWLGVTPCEAVLSSATMRLPLCQKSFTDARRDYFSPPGLEKQKREYLDAIERAAYKSTERQSAFVEMRRWTSEIQMPFPRTQLLLNDSIAQKRDWAFPLYSHQQLMSLVRGIQHY